MKVLQINSVCGKGSTGRIATDLHERTVFKGHNSTLAFGRDSAKDSNGTIRIGNRIDNYLHFVRTRMFDAHGFSSTLATKKFIKKIEALDPDVIHLHNIHGYYLHVGLLFEYLKKYKKAVVWTLHDCWAFCGHCAYFDYIECSRWKDECYDCPLKGSYPRSIGLNRSRFNFRKKKSCFIGVERMQIVTPSRWLAGLVKESFLQEYPVKVINNGINLDIFKPADSVFRQKYNLENKFIVLGVASVWEKRKGYSYFLELAKHLKSDETIVLVGVSRKQSRDLPLNIIGLSHTNSTKELAEIYSSADIFINPTLEEVFGMVNIEALACGTPVVTFDSGGSPECLDDLSGFVVKRGDLRGLLDTIAIVKRRGRVFYSNNCQKRARKLFNKDEKIAEYIELYAKLAADPSYVNGDRRGY